MNEDNELQRKREKLAAHIRKKCLDRVEELKRQYRDRPYPIEISGKVIPTTFETAGVASDSPQPGNVEIYVRASPEIVIDGPCYVPNELGEMCFGVARTVRQEGEEDKNGRLIITSALSPSSSRNRGPRQLIYSPKIDL